MSFKLQARGTYPLSNIKAKRISIEQWPFTQHPPGKIHSETTTISQNTPELFHNTKDIIQFLARYYLDKLSPEEINEPVKQFWIEETELPHLFRAINACPLWRGWFYDKVRYTYDTETQEFAVYMATTQVHEAFPCGVRDVSRDVVPAFIRRKGDRPKYYKNNDKRLGPSEDADKQPLLSQFGVWVNYRTRLAEPAIWAEPRTSSEQTVSLKKPGLVMRTRAKTKALYEAGKAGKDKAKERAKEALATSTSKFGRVLRGLRSKESLGGDGSSLNPQPQADNSSTPTETTASNSSSSAVASDMNDPDFDPVQAQLDADIAGLVESAKSKIPDCKFGCINHDRPCGIIEHAHSQTLPSVKQAVRAQLSRSEGCTRWAIVLVTSYPFVPKMRRLLGLTNQEITLHRVDATWEPLEDDPNGELDLRQSGDVVIRNSAGQWASNVDTIAISLTLGDFVPLAWQALDRAHPDMDDDRFHNFYNVPVVEITIGQIIDWLQSGAKRDMLDATHTGTKEVINGHQMEGKRPRIKAGAYGEMPNDSGSDSEALPSKKRKTSKGKGRKGGR